MPIEEVFENLRCSKEGLTTQAADERLALFGHNKLEEKKVTKFDFADILKVWVFATECVLCIVLK